MHIQRFVGFAAILPLCFSFKLTARQDCTSDFKICDPKGATTSSLGPIGSSWDNLFNDVVNIVSNYSIDDIAATHTVDPNGPARRTMAFCCSNVANCLLVKPYGIPMCWDRFTTNVFFPDGTFGTIVTGDFNTSDGDIVNLVYGDYVLNNGEKGNIYQGAAASSMKPETATMSMPKAWTSSGEGSAIPATGLGTMASLSTGTTTIAATTKEPSTADSITVVATMTGCNHCSGENTTIPGPTRPGATYSASTSTFTTAIITPTMTASQATMNLMAMGLLVVGITISTISSYT